MAGERAAEPLAFLPQINNNTNNNAATKEPNMIHNAKHATGGPYTDGTATQMVHMLLKHDLPEEGELVIDGIKGKKGRMEWANVRMIIHRVTLAMGISVKTRVRDGKLVVWRVQP